MGESERESMLPSRCITEQGSGDKGFLLGSAIGLLSESLNSFVANLPVYKKGAMLFASFVEHFEMN